MKQKISPKLVLVAALLLCSLYASAYSFETDGIYYLVVSSTDLTCEVTYETTSYNSYSGSVTIPEKVTRSSDGKTYTVIGIGSSAFRESTELTSVVIPTTITYIAIYAFYNSSLTSVDIPTSVTEIGNSAFYGCSSLTSVDIPDSVTTMANNAFYGCSSLTSVIIGNSVTTIGNHAFYNCSSLTSVAIPDSVTSIGNSAFYDCSSLTSLTIGSSVTSIGEGAFWNCISLMGELNIPDSVTSIGHSAFYECTGLTSLTLGNSVESIDYYAFYNCTNLTSIYSLKPEPPVCGKDPWGWGHGAFDEIDKDACTLYVPIGSYNAYATADQWEEFTNIVEMDMTGIERVSVDDAEVTGYYTIDGKAVDAPQRGINIVKYSDGTTKKVLVK